MGFNCYTNKPSPVANTKHPYPRNGFCFSFIHLLPLRFLCINFHFTYFCISHLSELILSQDIKSITSSIYHTTMHPNGKKLMCIVLVVLLTCSIKVVVIIINDLWITLSVKESSNPLAGWAVVQVRHYDITTVCTLILFDSIINDLVTLLPCYLVTTTTTTTAHIFLQ